MAIQMANPRSPQRFQFSGHYFLRVLRLPLLDYSSSRSGACEKLVRVSGEVRACNACSDGGNRTNVAHPPDACPR